MLISPTDIKEILVNHYFKIVVDFHPSMVLTILKQVNNVIEIIRFSTCLFIYEAKRL